jgi:hypothetical protein
MEARDHAPGNRNARGRGLTDDRRPGGDDAGPEIGNAEGKSRSNTTIVALRQHRRRLPDRRGTVTITFTWRDHTYTLSYARFEDGAVGELFLQNSKPGSQLDSYARDAAIAASLAMQHGCGIDTLRRAALREEDGTPSTPLGAALDRIAEEERR